MKYKVEISKTNRYCYINAVTESGERIGKVCIDLDPDDSMRYIKMFGGKFAKIIIVSTAESYLGQGVATALLNKAVDFLKGWNLYLNVIPLKRNGQDKDRNQLVRFYSKFGFQKYDLDLCTTTMVKLN